MPSARHSGRSSCVHDACACKAVVFLASANASYITGATLTVDGGANA
ncbi:SDR family oxidoreductase [Caballeronia insecticola]|uniref:3-oxoacyl-(Acyl-carrier-protein) reductase n=1 Tax=Caballeronia insecticola TaxID=758793 RepID=R4X297_9BURK|nr:SDR family oxidoreductase [Caballeronia insecticola]BAN26596.1 3-oxoacyl-(Acyl-carrier-protein) reductase [Caballeronia insecticola]